MRINKPCASLGLTSYRYKGSYGYIMIGAISHARALSEANRSLTAGNADITKLEVWDGNKYVPAIEK